MATTTAPKTGTIAAGSLVPVLDAFPTSTGTSEVAALSSEIGRLHRGEHLTVTEAETGLAAQLLVVPKDKEVLDLKEYFDARRPAPERRTGTATLQTLASFIDHVNRSKDAHSALFAHRDKKAPALTAVYDYHEMVKDVAERGVHHPEAKPRFGTHRAKYAFPLSDEWLAWTGANGKPMGQAEFAAFLEDRIADVVAPPNSDKFLALAELLKGNFGGPSTLMQLARGLAINVDTQVQDAITLASGEISVKYSEVHRDGAGDPISVPNLFVLGIRVFYEGAAYHIPIRLRYRLQQGRLTWSFHLHGTDKAFDDAFTEACTLVQEQTSVPLFYGAPEA